MYHIIGSWAIAMMISGTFIPLELKTQNPQLQQTIIGIEQTISKSDAQGLTKFLDEFVEVTINDAENTYPKTQATYVLREFFMKNKLQSFHILHKGGSANSFYAIGEYNSSQGKFDANLFIKKVNSTYLIERIRFEKEK